MVPSLIDKDVVRDKIMRISIIVLQNGTDILAHRTYFLGACLAKIKERK